MADSSTPADPPSAVVIEEQVDLAAVEPPALFSAMRHSDISPVPDNGIPVGHHRPTFLAPPRPEPGG